MNQPTPPLANHRTAARLKAINDASLEAIVLLASTLTEDQQRAWQASLEERAQIAVFAYGGGRAELMDAARRRILSALSVSIESSLQQRRGATRTR